MVADAGEGVAIDRVVGQLGEVRPGLQAMGVAGGHRRHRRPTTIRRERPGRVEGGDQLGVRWVEDRLGAPGSEVDCMFGGHRAMLGVCIHARCGHGRVRRGECAGMRRHTPACAGARAAGMSAAGEPAVLFAPC